MTTSNTSNPDDTESFVKKSTKTKSTPEAAMASNIDEGDAMLQVNPKNGSDDDDAIKLIVSDRPMSASLSPNTYSILFVCNPCSPAFLFGIAFFLFQVSLASLALVDLISFDSGNVLKVPADIEPYVRGAGYLATVLAVPLFTDLLDSVERMHEGYDQHAIMDQQDAPYATRTKFYFAYGCQFLSGAVFQCVIFILIVQSTTVIGMLLNFAALQFVTEVDDLAFSLAERGYFSQTLKECTDKVQQLQTPDTKGPWLRRIAFAIIVATVLTGYSLIWYWQASGEYLCNRIEVQFGDAPWSELPLFSGVYYANKNKKANDRFVYEDEISGTSLFRYCHNVEAWVFGYTNVWSDDEEGRYDAVCNPGNADHHPGWYSKSPTTTSFDIFTTNPSEWVVNTPEFNSLTYPVDHFSMRCLDCKPSTCNGLGGQCVSNVDLSDAMVCECFDGHTGNECQYDIVRSVCDRISIDQRFDTFSSHGVAFASTFETVKDPNSSTSDLILLFGKPVYAFPYTDPASPSFGYVDIIAYFGRRFFALEFYRPTLFPNATSTTTQEDVNMETAAYDFVQYVNSFRESTGIALNFDFWASLPAVYPRYISDSVSLGTVEDTLMPTDLGWNFVQFDSIGAPLLAGPSIGTRLLCGQCNDRVFNCGRGGICVFDDLGDEEDEKGAVVEDIVFGTCQCHDGFFGTQCELFDPTATSSPTSSPSGDTNSSSRHYYL